MPHELNIIELIAIPFASGLLCNLPILAFHWLKRWRRNNKHETNIGSDGLNHRVGDGHGSGDGYSAFANTTAAK